MPPPSYVAWTTLPAGTVSGTPSFEGPPSTESLSVGVCGGAALTALMLRFDFSAAALAASSSHTADQLALWPAAAAPPISATSNCRRNAITNHGFDALLRHSHAQPTPVGITKCQAFHRACGSRAFFYVSRGSHLSFGVLQQPRYALTGSIRPSSLGSPSSWQSRALRRAARTKDAALHLFSKCIVHRALLIPRPRPHLLPCQVQS